MTATLVLLGIAAFVIVVGVVITVVGAALDPGPQRFKAYSAEEPPPPPTLSQILGDLIKQSFAIIFDTTDKYRKWQRFSAFGVTLVFLGFAFLLAAGITGIITSALNAGAATGAGASPSATPS